MQRRGLLVAILVYVTLDLSLASMPGAFVFEPSDSVESTYMKRGRAMANDAVVPASPVSAFDVVPPRAGIPVRTALAGPVARDRDRVLPRSALEPAPSAEDPH